VPEPARTSAVGRFRVRHFADLDSTNAYLLVQAAAGEPDGLVAVADHQTAGRGRLGRRWEAPPGSSLLVSVLTRLDDGPDRASHVVMAAALALADAVAANAGFDPDVKWPNDLEAGGRKLAGILAERSGDAVVVGAGLNVAWDAFPAELEDLATSCNLEAGRPVDRAEILEAYLAGLDPLLATLDAVPAAYRARLSTIGRRVHVVTGRGPELSGTAVDVLVSGALVVRTDDGREHEITTADVTHLRAE
jgi:BirA family transcriptional regulator, biotin operon repressor / biotin---[acetyl-CoA-carboxylase] ligase